MKNSIKKGISIASAIHFFAWCSLLLVVVIVPVFVDSPENLDRDQLKAWTVSFGLLLRYFSVVAGFGLVSSALLFLSIRGWFLSYGGRLRFSALVCSGAAMMIVYLVVIMSFFIRSFDVLLLLFLIAAISWLALAFSCGVLLLISSKKRAFCF